MTPNARSMEQSQPAVSREGRPLLIQGPAWGPSSDYLRLTLAPLLAGCRVVTYDPRNVGTGVRIDDPDAQAVEHLVADLERLRQQLGLERFVLAGHSHGGFVAMAYAVRHGDRLDGLLLLNTKVRTVPPDAATEAVLRRFERDPARRQAVELFRATAGRPAGVGTDAELARHMRRLMPAYFFDLDAMHRFAAAARGARAPSASALLRMPGTPESWVEDLLPTVDVAALVLTGRFDVATTPADAERIHRLLPRSRLEIFERSGHHPWIEERERFTALVSDFIDGLPQR